MSCSSGSSRHNKTCLTGRLARRSSLRRPRQTIGEWRCVALAVCWRVWEPGALGQCGYMTEAADWIQRRKRGVNGLWHCYSVDTTLTRVVFSCTMLASVACRSFHSSGHFFSLWRAHARARTHTVEMKQKVIPHTKHARCLWIVLLSPGAT